MNSKKGLVIGYYNHDNLGDDAYQEIIPNFFKTDLEFVSSDELEKLNANDYQFVIIGGGDLVNDYFQIKIDKFLELYNRPKIGFSIGFPFPNLINEQYLRNYDHIFTRNYQDLKNLQLVMGSERAHYIPDLVLSKSNPKISVERSFRRCGVSIIGNLIRYPKIIDSLVHLIQKLSLTYDVIIYSFDHREDLELAKLLVERSISEIELLTKSKQLNLIIDRIRDGKRITYDENRYSMDEMINIFNNLDFAVNLRYHAHIFSIITNTPFLSISSTRKTKLLIDQIGISRYQYQLDLDSNSNPVDIDYSKLKLVCRRAIRESNIIKNQIHKFDLQSKYLLDSFQVNQIINRNNLMENIQSLIENRDYDNVSRLISRKLIGYPDSGYVWGISDQIRNSKPELLNSVIDRILEFLLLEKKLRIPKIIPDLSKQLPINIDLNEYQSYNGIHRGGWYLICEKIYERCSKNNSGRSNGMICDMYVDRTFHWVKNYMLARGKIPYSSPWCGFIHHTINQQYSDYNIVKLFQTKEFIQSLNQCRALFVLSEKSKYDVINKLSTIAPQVKVFNFNHPILIPDRIFNPDTFMNRRPFRLIHIGSWLRNPFSVYRIEKKNFQKYILIGKDMNGNLPPTGFSIQKMENKILENEFSTTSITACRDPKSTPRWVKMVKQWISNIGIINMSYESDSSILYLDADNEVVEKINLEIQDMILSVIPVYQLTNDEYDQWLESSVVFIDLIDASAVNTLIECLVRRTPIIINRLPSVVEVLGENYPLYFSQLSNVNRLLNPDRIVKAHQYLKSVDIRKYQIDYFIDQFKNVINEIDQESILSRINENDDRSSDYPSDRTSGRTSSKF